MTARYGYTRNEEPADVPTPVRDYDGFDLPANLLAYGWDCDADQINRNWTQGLDGLVLHSDHGWPGGLGDPEYASGDLEVLGAGAGPWLPIVLSVNCSSGWFDTEADYARRWDSSSRVTCRQRRRQR